MAVGENFKKEKQSMTSNQFATHLINIHEKILRDGITFEAVIRGYCLVEIPDSFWSELATLLLSSSLGRPMLWAEMTRRENQIHQPNEVDNHL